MSELGVSGATRGKARKTTIADPAAARPADVVQRRFGPPAPNRLCVADLTYVSTWSGFAYVTYVTGVYARRILGWRVASRWPTRWSSMRSNTPSGPDNKKVYRI
jgi:putative transposase